MRIVLPVAELSARAFFTAEKFFATLEKHNVTFEMAAQVFLDEFLIGMVDKVLVVIL